MKTKLPARGPGGWPVSLEIRLPFLITALLIVIVAGVVWASYTEVRRSAREAAADRANVVTSTVATGISVSLERRIRSLTQMARDPAVVAYLRAGSPDMEPGARRALRRLPISGDSFPAEVWSADRKPLLHEGRARNLEPHLAPAWQPQAMLVPDSGGVGPFILGEKRVHMWAAVPVEGGGRRLGWVAQLLGVAAGPLAEQVEALIEPGMELRTASQPGTLWLSSDGRRLAVPAAWPFSGRAEYEGADGARRVAFAQRIPGSALFVVAEMSERDALARSRAFLSWVAAVAMLLVLLGAVAAWWLSRSVTRPLKRLQDASSAVAAGHYAQRVDVERRDELGRLAHSFNHMAEQVQTAHRDLEEQFAAAQSMAGDLARANAQLHDAMHVAEAAHAEAQQASRAKSEFLATMSHEIRTPINAMIGYTDLLDMGIVDAVTDRQREQLERIRASGRHLMRLVDEVLDLAGIESGRLRLERRVARLAQACETAVVVLRPQAINCNIELTCECQCTTPSNYVGDPQRVEQIVVNLASNAVKFTPPDGKVRVVCRIRHFEGRDWGEIVVEDTGVGIPPEQLERIFEPFVQVETGYTREHGGVGLGLAISRHLARMMGGDITVESRPGAGSRFTLSLPAAQAVAPLQTA